MVGLCHYVPYGRPRISCIVRVQRRSGHRSHRPAFGDRSHHGRCRCCFSQQPLDRCLVMAHRHVASQRSHLRQCSRAFPGGSDPGSSQVLAQCILVLAECVLRRDGLAHCWVEQVTEEDPRTSGQVTGSVAPVLEFVALDRAPIRHLPSIAMRLFPEFCRTSPNAQPPMGFLNPGSLGVADRSPAVPFLEQACRRILAADHG